MKSQAKTIAKIIWTLSSMNVLIYLVLMKNQRL